MNTLDVQSAGRQISSTFFGRVVVLFGAAIGVSALGAYFGFNQISSVEGLNMLPGLMIGAMIAELALIFTSHWWSKTRPLNYILFAAFAFISGFTVAPIIFQLVLKGSGALVTQALLATMLTFVAAGLIAWKTNVNMFRFQGFLVMALIGMVIMGVISIFFPMGGLVNSIYSFFGILLFTAFIMLDIQRIRYSVAQNEIEIALALYLDIFNLFLFILRFLDRDR